MPRQLRRVLPGIAMHVIQRGNNRSRCFLTDSDYLLYLLHLQELARKFRTSVHAYCLMPNHVHLLFTPSSEDGCMCLMRELGQRYVQYFNRCHGRTGTLWEGRFRSSLVESAHYVLACYRYIELNPVRAGIAAAPQHYVWSSHKGTAGERIDPLLSAHAEWLALGLEADTQRKAYLGLFERPLEEALLREIRTATNAGYPLAGEHFKATVLAPLGFKLEPKPPGPPPRSQSPAPRSSGSDPDLGFGL